MNQMEIIERKVAAAAGLTHYYTGKPCMHGHITQRYTQSGTCAGCVAVSSAAGRDATHRISDERRAALDQLVDAKMRCYERDFVMLRDVAFAMTKARFPALTDADIFVKPVPTGAAGGTAMYRFMVALEDVQPLRDVSNALLSAIKKDFSHVHARVLKFAEGIDHNDY